MMILNGANVTGSESHAFFLQESATLLLRLLMKEGQINLMWYTINRPGITLITRKIARGRVLN